MLRSTVPKSWVSIGQNLSLLTRDLRLLAQHSPDGGVHDESDAFARVDGIDVSGSRLGIGHQFQDVTHERRQIALEPKTTETFDLRKGKRQASKMYIYQASCKCPVTPHDTLSAYISYQFYVSMRDSDSDFAVDGGRSFDVFRAAFEEPRAALQEPVGEDDEHILGREGRG